MTSEPIGDKGYLGCAHDPGGGEAGTWCWPCVRDLLSETRLIEERDAARAEVERLKADLKVADEYAHQMASRWNQAEAALARVRAQLKACEERNQ